MSHSRADRIALRAASLGAALLALLPTAAANDLRSLSDEFECADSLVEWLRVNAVEEWNADQLEICDVDATQAGRLVMVPHTGTWFQDWRGPLAYKEVEGDFVLTTRVHVSAHDGVSIPGVAAQFSLAGLMVRAPRDITPATWTPGGENFVFLSLGYGNAQPATHQFEVKTTVDSNSTLILSTAPGPTAMLQMARIGPHVITLRREPGQPWQVHGRYFRPDLPERVQIGFVSYTDWAKTSVFSPFVHNSNTLDDPLPPDVVDPAPGVPFRPDLIASFDFARFFRPELPPRLTGANLNDPGEVSDEALLAFLGQAANRPAFALSPLLDPCLSVTGKTPLFPPGPTLPPGFPFGR